MFLLMIKPGAVLLLRAFICLPPVFAAMTGYAGAGSTVITAYAGAAAADRRCRSDFKGIGRQIADVVRHSAGIVADRTVFTAVQPVLA